MNMKKLLLLYRGDNPFMKAVRDELINRGVEVAERKVEMDYSQKSTEEQREMISRLMANSEGFICCDRTLKSTMTKVLGYEPLGAYDLLNKIPVDFESILEEIEKADKIPVVLESRLYDHATGSERESMPSILDNDNGNAKCVFKGRSLALLEESHVRVKYGEHRGNVAESLKTMGLEPEKVVILADHHIYELKSPEEIKKMGFNQVLVALVCPCCVGLRDTYTDNIKNKGFRLFGLQLTNQAKLVADAIFQSLIL